MFLLAKDVVFVDGAYNGAIYDFNTNNIYSINHDTCLLFKDLFNGRININEDQSKYINMLKDKCLYDENWFGKSFDTSKPIFKLLKTVWLELTMGCNCKCLHCYEGEIHRKMNNSLSLEEWKNVIKQIKKIGTERIILIGGEPCVYPNIIDIIKEVSGDNIDITLFTNATLIDDKIMEAIIKYGIRVKVSIYGHNSTIHDGITQNNGSFDKMVKAIKKLIYNNVNVSPSVIIMKENEKYIEDIKDFIISMGMKWTGFDIVREVGCGTCNSHTPSLDIKEMKVRKKASFKANKDFFVKTIYSNNCWDKKIVISENGDVFPCVFAREIICGNVKKNSIEEIINNELIRYWNYNFSNVDECKDCEFRFACKDCRPVAMAKTGLINSRTHYCKYNPYKGEWND